MAAVPAPERIISLSPSLTETLFAIGAGPRVQGVSEFCNFPPEVRRLPQVGGYYDTNYEAVLSLRPDLVVLLPENQEQKKNLESLKINTLTVEQHSWIGVINSFLMLGSACRCEAQGAWWAGRFRNAFFKARRATIGLEKKKTLLVISRDYGAGAIRDVYVAGPGSIYNELLKLAGGVNAYSSTRPPYPKLSAEGVLSLDPDVIVEFVPDRSGPKARPVSLQRDWTKLPGLRASRSGRIVVLAGDYLTIPGPRLLLVLADLIRALHPEMANFEF